MLGAIGVSDGLSAPVSDGLSAPRRSSDLRAGDLGRSTPRIHVRRRPGPVVLFIDLWLPFAALHWPSTADDLAVILSEMIAQWPLECARSQQRLYRGHC